ncbi:hypothetical protein EDC04DRAFT_3094496, partial [Pisolithus marmoratus]
MVYRIAGFMSRGRTRHQTPSTETVLPTAASQSGFRIFAIYNLINRSVVFLVQARSPAATPPPRLRRRKRLYSLYSPGSECTRPPEQEDNDNKHSREFFESLRPSQPRWTLQPCITNYRKTRWRAMICKHLNGELEKPWELRGVYDQNELYLGYVYASGRTSVHEPDAVKIMRTELWGKRWTTYVLGHGCFTSHEVFQSTSKSVHERCGEIVSPYGTIELAVRSAPPLLCTEKLLGSALMGIIEKFMFNPEAETRLDGKLPPSEVMWMNSRTCNGISISLDTRKLKLAADLTLMGVTESRTLHIKPARYDPQIWNVSQPTYLYFTETDDSGSLNHREGHSFNPCNSFRTASSISSSPGRGRLLSQQLFIKSASVFDTVGGIVGFFPLHLASSTAKSFLPWYGTKP